LSLFYRPHSPSDDPLALLATASKPSIPVHLRPTSTAGALSASLAAAQFVYEMVTSIVKRGLATVLTTGESI
jgi:hypothetical protein